MTELIAEIRIDHGPVQTVSGTDFNTMMQSIGLGAYTNTGIITSWTWIKGGDGYRDNRKPVEPPPKKLSKKAQKELEKWAKYNADPK